MQTRKPTLDDLAWQFSTSVTTEEVWDTFVILTLLDDHAMRGDRLVVPHDGQQKDRYTAVMYK